MPTLTDIPFAAVGLAAQTVRAAGRRAEQIGRGIAETADTFLSESKAEGRHAVARLPGSARVLGSVTDSRPVGDVVGVDASSRAALGTAGVTTIGELWEHAGDRTGRVALSGQTGIPAERLEGWAKHADLMRVKDIGPRYAVLLESVGVTSLKMLRRRSADSLHERLIEVNRNAKVVDNVPSVDLVARWIERADLLAG